MGTGNGMSKRKRDRPAVSRRRCAGDPYQSDRIGVTCAAPPTGAYLTIALVGDEPAAVLVACCDSHGPIVCDWLHEQALADGLWFEIDAIDDPAFVEALMGEVGPIYEHSLSARVG